MISEVFITADELREIANMVDRFNAMQATLSEPSPNISVDSPQLDTAYCVRDSNGDLLGHIQYGEGGFAFYLDDTQDVEA